MNRRLFDSEHDLFRDAFSAFVQREIAPNMAKWEQARVVDREVWSKAGAQGFLCMDVPEEFGGTGIGDFRYNLIVTEELSRAGAGAVAFPLHTDIAVPYLLRHANDEQKRRWLPGAVRGDCITAIAMTEPGAGSDLQGVATTAVRQGDHYLLNGQKTFISNGLLNDLVIVVARTDPSKGHKGISLLVVERGMEGYDRGRNLEKIGLHAQDTAELFFRDVKVPVANLLGEEGRGFAYLMSNLPVERLIIAAGSVTTAETCLASAVQYCRERKAFGQSLAGHQHVRFELAEMETEVTLGRVFVDRCVEELNAGTLTTEVASMAKWWATDMAQRVADRCLQLFGGYGYMTEYPIAKAWADHRVTLIYGGSNEIMKEIIGRRLVSGD